LFRCGADSLCLDPPHGLEYKLVSVAFWNSVVNRPNASLKLRPKAFDTVRASVLDRHSSSVWVPCVLLVLNPNEAAALPEIFSLITCATVCMADAAWQDILSNDNLYRDLRSVRYHVYHSFLFLAGNFPFQDRETPLLALGLRNVGGFWLIMRSYIDRGAVVHERLIHFDCNPYTGQFNGSSSFPQHFVEDKCDIVK